jgi:predicted cupin superfamily sugar epimerase
MHPRAAELIATLGLEPHPEGGWYREIHRSLLEVKPGDDRSERPALTSIYFLLAEDEVSRWHRVGSDEAWHFHEGAVVELLIADPGIEHIVRQTLGPASDVDRPVRVVPAHSWQAARSTGAYSLVGCSVGPGFDFADFALLHDTPPLATKMRDRHPEVAFLE